MLNVSSVQVPKCFKCPGTQMPKCLNDPSAQVLICVKCLKYSSSALNHQMPQDLFKWASASNALKFSSDLSALQVASAWESQVF